MGKVEEKRFTIMDFDPSKFNLLRLNNKSITFDF